MKKARVAIVAIVIAVAYNAALAYRDDQAQQHRMQQQRAEIVSILERN